MKLELTELVVGTLYEYVDHVSLADIHMRDTRKKVWDFVTIQNTDDPIHGPDYTLLGWLEPGDLVVFIESIPDEEAWLAGKFLSKFGLGRIRRVDRKEIGRRLFFKEASSP